MKGIIHITGEIGVDVFLKDIINQVKSQKMLAYYVVINSVGGYVDEGFEIYDYLKGLQVPITTIAENVCASVATVIFMAGNERIVRDNCKFMIHAPSVTVPENLKSHELEMWTIELKKIDKKIIDFYATNTSLEKSELESLLKKDTYLTLDECKNFGFATQINEYKPMAKMSINLKPNKMTEEEKSWIMQGFASIAKLFKPKALLLQDSTGAEIIFADLGEGDTPKVGDIATVDGQPANGEYVMPQLGNATVTFVDGAITEIEVVEQESEEMKALKAENEKLKADLATATANMKTIETEFVQLKAQITSKMKVDTVIEPPTPPATFSYKENLKKIKK